jgi:hypothetical protein
MYTIDAAAEAAAASRPIITFTILTQTLLKKF